MKTDTYLCIPCQDSMCDDCRNITDEYIDLATRRGYELARLNDLIEKQRAKIQELERQVAIWKDAASIGYPDLMQAWLQAEAEKAQRKGRREMRRELAPLLKRVKELEKMRKETPK